jgi:hypothetical protein
MAFTQDVHTPHPVRSEPLANGKPVVRGPKPQASLYALAIVLFIFGGIGWLAGGKYTVEGWIVALNMFARWIGIEQQLTVPRGWWLVGAVLVSGVVYSKVEVLALRNTVQRMPAFWIGWLLIVATDIGSTLLGVLNPAPNAAPILIQLASIVPLAIVWAIALTFVPEWLILSATRLLRR